MIIDPHTYAEGFIQEDEVKKSARARGEEIGAIDAFFIYAVERKVDLNQFF